MLIVPHRDQPVVITVERAMQLLWAVPGLAISVVLPTMYDQAEMKAVTKRVCERDRLLIGRTVGYLQDLGKGVPMEFAVDPDKLEEQTWLFAPTIPTQQMPKSASSSEPVPAHPATASQERGRKRKAQEQAAKDEGATPKKSQDGADDKLRDEDLKAAKAGRKAKPKGKKAKVAEEAEGGGGDAAGSGGAPASQSQ